MKLSVFNMHRSNRDEMPDTLPRDGLDKADPSITSSAMIQLSEVRLKILNRLLLAAGGLGLPVLLISLPLLIRSQQWGTIGLAAVILIGIIWVAFNRRLSSSFRTGLLLVGLLATGWGVLLSDGLFGSGRVFIVTIPILAAVFVSRRGRIVWLVLAVSVFALTGIAMITGIIPPPQLQPGVGNSSLFSWAAATAVLTLLSIFGTVSLGMLIEGLEKSLQTQQSLLDELEAEQALLEQRVRSRTADLERRVGQVRTAAEVTATINRSFSMGGVAIDLLLPKVCELVRERFNLYYVGAFLVESDRSGDTNIQYAVLKAGTGEAGKALVTAGHRLLVGSESMIGWTCQNRQPRIALDVGADAVRFNNPYLPHTRSELALPILTGLSDPSISQGPGDIRVLGALSIQSSEEAAFDEDDIVALQGIADNLAVAIENARLFTQMQTSLNEIETLHRQYLEGAWGRKTARGDLSYTFTSNKPVAEPEICSSAVTTMEVPIRLRDQIIGELVLEGDNSPNSNPWSAEDYSLAEAVVDNAALALENARLLEESQTAAEIERKASEITGKLWTTGDVDTILRTTLAELAASLGADEGSIEIKPSGSSRETSDARA